LSTSTPVANDAVPEHRDANANEPDHKHHGAEDAQPEEGESELALELGTDRREDAPIEMQPNALQACAW
jgi:hypothetical protein